MLGAPRTGITKVANDLRDAGIIRYRRGKITVSNREAMERLACDCYRKVKPELKPRHRECVAAVS
jgi:hypothetical protein